MKDWKALNQLKEISVNSSFRRIFRRKVAFWNIACVRRLVPRLSCRAFQIASEIGLAEVESLAEFVKEWIDPLGKAARWVPLRDGRFVHYSRGEIILILNARFCKESNEELEALGFNIKDDVCVLRKPNNEVVNLDGRIIASIHTLMSRICSEDMMFSARPTPWDASSKLDMAVNIFPCIFGPPTAPDLKPYLSWCNRLIPRLVETIYWANAWQEVGVLGDALEEAGCADPDVLWACRTPPHVRGFWVVDILRGLPHLPYEVKR